MKKFLFLFLLIISYQSFSQGLLCENSEPFCTGTIYNFPAGTTGSAQPGANYGCLQTQPAPAWYHMLIDDPGDINIYMYSTPLHDIDFICWGPFDDPIDPCVAGLTGNKIVDCSYSPNPTENCYIPNGQTGEYYILLITNYSQQPCHITFEQTSGSGTTDCTILPPPVGNNGPLCVGETLHLYADTIVNATYWWSGPGGFVSGMQNPVILNVTLANGGDYSCTITVNGQSSDPAITTVIVNERPTLAMTSGDTTICIGTPGYIFVDLTGWGPFEVDYDDGTNTYTATGLYGPSDTIFVYPTVPTTYTLTQVCDLHCCRAILGTSVSFDTYPYTSGTISGNASICEGEGADLNFNLTGESPWNITYTANGTNAQTIIANSSPHVITVYPTTNTVYQISHLEDINCEGETFDSVTVNVDPVAQVNAGQDETIPYGTYTTLNGQASGGSGSYSIHWEPAQKLVDPAVLSPQTVNLTESTLFTLTVTDNQGNCPNNDEVLVTIEGGALGCNPVADPLAICFGETSQLQALPTGGSGDYTYEWSSNPSGFNSEIPNPEVAPTETTTYMVNIHDGFNTETGSVTVIVHELPVADAGPNQTIPHGTNTNLSGTASGGSGAYAYHWEPAGKLVDPDVADPETNNLVATTLFTLTITDMQTSCICGDPAQMTVTVSGDALSVSPAASPEEMCLGESTQLFALGGGGSGSYGYSWSSASGFYSSEENPMVSPLETTLYTITIDDGFNQATGTVAVTVYDVPVVYLGSDTSVCVYDTIILDAGNPGASHLWSNGSTEQTIKAGSTGIGFDIKTYSVIVTNDNGCETEETITVFFDFSQCLGITAHEYFGTIYIYPNPNDGNFSLRVENYSGDLDIMVTDLTGKVLYREQSTGIRGSFKKELHLNELPTGVYLIRLMSDSHIYHEKIIIR